MSDGPSLSRSMGPVDAMFWQLEKERTLRSTMMAVAVFDGEVAQDLVRGSLLRTCRRIPRLTQHVVELPGGISAPVWREDPDFELGAHLRRVGAPGAGDLASLLELVSSMAMQGFDRARPLWEFVVVEGLSGGRSALIQKLHHSVGDGAAGLALIGELFDLEPQPSRSEAEPERAAGDLEVESILELAAEAVGRDLASTARGALRAFELALEAAREPAETARRLGAELEAVTGIMRSGPGPLSPIMRGRSSRTRHSVLTVPEADVLSAARAHGCSFNDAFVSALAGGLALYHERRGAPVQALRAAIPISIRSEGGGATMGNRLAIGRFPVPCGEKEPAPRMAAIQHRIAAQRNPASLGAFEVVASLVQRAPRELILPLVLEEMRKSDVVATSLPGPTNPLFLAGRRVDSFFTFGPTAGAAVNATLFRYHGQASVGLTVDPAAVPDLELMTSCLSEAFDQVVSLGGQAPIPSGPRRARPTAR